MSKTPRTDREVYKISAKDVGFEAVNPALCREFESQVGEVIEYGKQVAVWITGDPSDAQEVKVFNFALAAIKYAHDLGMQRNNALNELRAQYNELIMAVGNKWPGETRHQTALRYIHQAEGRHRVYKEGEANANQAKASTQDQGKAGA